MPDSISYDGLIFFSVFFQSLNNKLKIEFFEILMYIIINMFCDNTLMGFFFILFLDDCESGTELKPNGQCVKCERGYYRSFLEESCQPCPEGSTTAANGSTSDKLCDISMYHFNVPIKTLNERRVFMFYFCWKQLNYT